MEATKLKPSAWFYGLAVLVMIAGVAAFVFFLLGNMSELGKSLTRVVVPGSGEVELAEAGEYTIYHEYRSIVGDRIYSGSDSLTGLQCAVRSKATGAQMPLTPASTSSSYRVGSRSGVAAFEFTITQPGIYEVSASYPAGQPAPQTVLAIGRGFVGRVFGTVVVGLAIMFGTAAITIAIIVVTFLKRRKFKSRLEAPDAGMNWPPPSPPPMR